MCVFEKTCGKQVPAIVKDIEDMIRSHPQVDSVTHRLVGWRQARCRLVGQGDGWVMLGQLVLVYIYI